MKYLPLSILHVPPLQNMPSWPSVKELNAACRLQNTYIYRSSDTGRPLETMSMVHVDTAVRIEGSLARLIAVPTCYIKSSRLYHSLSPPYRSARRARAHPSRGTEPRLLIHNDFMTIRYFQFSWSNGGRLQVLRNAKLGVAISLSTCQMSQPICCSPK